LPDGACHHCVSFEISADGTNKSPSVLWVTQTVMDTFNAAISSAESAGDTNRDALYTALVAALNIFKEAQQPGTRAKTVTITGLPAAANGAGIQVGLFPTKSIQNPDKIGRAHV
jgi:hypothetical protein